VCAVAHRARSRIARASSLASSSFFTSHAPAIFSSFARGVTAAAPRRRAVSSGRAGGNKRLDIARLLAMRAVGIRDRDHDRFHRSRLERRGDRPTARARPVSPASSSRGPSFRAARESDTMVRRAVMRSREGGERRAMVVALDRAALDRASRVARARASTMMARAVTLVCASTRAHRRA
jgi:hypothetical protein